MQMCAAVEWWFATESEAGLGSFCMLRTMCAAGEVMRGVPTKRSNVLALQLEAMSVMCADTACPRCCDGLLLPLSDLLAKINIPRSEC